MAEGGGHSNEGKKELTSHNVINLLREKGFRFKDNWKKIGRKLEVPLEKRTQHDSDNDYETALEECVDYWIRNDHNPSWEKLISIIADVDKSTARHMKDSQGGLSHDEITNVIDITTQPTDTILAQQTTITIAQPTDTTTQLTDPRNEPVDENSSTSTSMKTVGNFRFDIKIIGIGSEKTVVYKGHLIKEKRRVAIKCIYQSQEENDSFIKKFKEIDKLVKCDSHCNVVQFFGYEYDPPDLYIALKLCTTSLGQYIETDEGKEKLREEGLMVPVDNKAILLGVMKGLEHLHELDIVHRDVKPDNILLTRKSAAGNEVKAVLCDFGISTEIKVGRTSATTDYARGTKGWKAPELCTDEATKKTCSHGTDIFGMGCVSFYLLSCGGHPFGKGRGEDCEREAHSNISKEAQEECDSYKGTYPLEKLPTTCDSNTAEHLIKQMIVKQRDQRLSATEVLNHCYFWSNEFQLEFIQNVSDCLASKKNKNNPVSANAIASIENNAKDVIGDDLDWKKEIDPVVKQELDNNKYCKYDGSFLERLLRAIRNLNHHYDEVSPAVSNVIGSSSNDLLHYFMSKFPSLLIHTYENLKGSKEKFPSLKKFYL